MRTNSLDHQRRLLKRFIVVSVVLHLAVFLGGIVPTWIHRATEARLMTEASERARLNAKQKREDAERAAEEAKRTATTRAIEETRQDTTAELKNQFNALVGEQLEGPDADAVWDEILARLTAGLDGYSQQLADANASDADVRETMTELQAKMLEELSKRLHELGAKQLADAFVSRVEGEVAPKLIEFYRQQLQNKIGNALRDEGSRIVREDAADVTARRQAVAQALADAEQQSRAAHDGLMGAQNQLNEQVKAAGAGGDAANKFADAAKARQADIDKAAAAIEAARGRLAEAVTKADVLSGAAGKALADASVGAGGVKAQVTKAANDAKDGKAAELTKSSFTAADAAGKLADAIHSARDAVAKENGDSATGARVGVKHARDDEIKELIEKSFWDNYGKRAVPRLGDKLTDVFRQTLDDAGMKDDAAVAEVKKRVEAALLDKVRDKINAGDAGTEALSKAEHLDDIADPNDTAPVNPAGGKSTSHRHGSGPGGDRAATTAAGSGQSGGRESAVVEKIEKSARDLIGPGTAAIGDDAGNDEAIARIAKGNDAPKFNPEDPVAVPGITGLAGRVAELAQNVKAGRTELADATRGPGAAAATNGIGPAGLGLSRLRQSAFERATGRLLRPGYRLPDEAEYSRLTQGIHDRDPNAARGQSTTRQSIDGAVASLADNAGTLAPGPAAVLVPALKQTPGGVAEKKAPFKPSFKSIRFAAVPYRAKPVTIDGDLSEWSDVPELPMTPALYGDKSKVEQKPLPQTVRIQWDSTGFYLAYDVKDLDGKITKADPANFWEGDGVEFWVDTLNTKDKLRVQSSHQFWAWVDGSAKDPNIVGGEAQRWAGKDDYIGLGRDVIKTASKKTPAGWTIEFFVPASRFRMLDLQPGRVLGMNCSICTGTNIYYYWAGTTEVATARRPDTWGDILLGGSAGTLECIDRLASELKPSESVKPEQAIRIGEPLRVRVTDPDMNLSNMVKDRIAVVATTARGGRETLLLEETTETSGVFEGAIQTLPDTGGGDLAPGKLSLLDGDQVELTYTDACRPDGARDVRVKLTIPTASAVTGAAGAK